MIENALIWLSARRLAVCLSVGTPALLASMAYSLSVGISAAVLLFAIGWVMQANDLDGAETYYVAAFVLGLAAAVV